MKLLFDRVALLALGENTSAKSTTLSGYTIALILACTGLLEDRTLWGEMTDTEWDELESIIATLVDEAS